MNRVKLFIMDVDGTLTDGKIYMGEQGEIMKAFNVKDGYAIHNLMIPAGIIPIILTGRQSKIIENRSIELGIKYIYQNISNKLEKIREIAEQFGCALGEIVHIGDDLNDLASMREINFRGGITACPADAVNEIRSTALWISSKRGGDGVVREILERLL